MFHIVGNECCNKYERTEYKSTPLFFFNFCLQFPFSAKKNGSGEQNHHQSNNQRGYNGSGPGSRDQEKDIPCYERLGPADQCIEEDVVEDIPHCKAKDKPGELLTEGFAGQGAHSDKHNYSGQLSKYFRKCQIWEDGRQRKAESFRVHYFPKVNYHSTFEHSHSNGKDRNKYDFVVEWSHPENKADFSINARWWGDIVAIIQLCTLLLSIYIMPPT